MSLSKKLNRWKEQQFITAEQCEKILAFEGRRATHTFRQVAFIIAGLSIGLGICLLVAANWATLGSVAKLLGDFIILGGFFYATYWSITHQRKGQTELFAILSFLGIGATIGLIAQVFHLSGGWTSFTSAWALLSLPFVLISRSKFFHIVWIILFCNIFPEKWIQALVRQLEYHFRVIILEGITISCLLSYIAKWVDTKVHAYTSFLQTVAKITLLIGYVLVFVLGLSWTFDNENSLVLPLLSILCALAFFAGRMFLAFRTYNMVSFRRNAILTEIYIFILFLRPLSSLLMSGLGLILGGLIMLGMIKVFKHTSSYIKKIGVFQ